MNATRAAEEKRRFERCLAITRREPRSSTPSALLGVRGVGEKKLADLGQRFIDEIMTYCRENRLQMDV
jgi:hypothetical protein